jgi:hypothetical protein
MLFVLALIVPPAVVIISFMLLALPVRREQRAPHHSRAHAH